MLSGAGTIQLEGSCRVALTGDVTFGIGILSMTGSSSIAGAFTLTIAAGSTLQFDHSFTIPGSFTVNGILTLTSSSIILTINGTLTLNSGGVLNNPGTVRDGAFINTGGTINGNPPEQLSPSPGGLRIAAINIAGGFDNRAHAAVVTTTGRILVLDCRALPGQVFVLETSTDLKHWSTVAADIAEMSSGVFRVTAAASDERTRFFRLRSTQPN